MFFVQKRHRNGMVSAQQVKVSACRDTRIITEGQYWVSEENPLTLYLLSDVLSRTTELSNKSVFILLV